ncbi:pyridoxal phosphate-dependent transferase [Corynascus similis CBS 632.67]
MASLTAASTANSNSSNSNSNTSNASTNTASVNEKQSPQKKLINLLRGWPAPSLLPASDLKSAANYVLSDPAIAVPVLQYGIDPGYQPLREELARWLSELYPKYSAPSSSSPDGGDGGRGEAIRTEGKGAGITADEITITGGASQSLACVLQSFTDPGFTRAVWVVAPCYFMACPIFEDNGFRGRLRAVPEDDGGVDVGVLEKRIRECEAEPWEHRPLKNPYPDRKLYRHVIYLVATCANPSGKTMSLARREQLVHLAREYDALIISDDVYDLLQWPVTPLSSLPPAPTSSSSSASSFPLPPLLPLLSQIDAALPPSRHNPPGTNKSFGHAISNASFSKLVGPGVRTGWIHASAPDFAHGFSITGTNRSGGAASQFAAAVVWRVLADGRLGAHVDHVVRPALRRRHALILDIIGRVLAPLGVSVWSGNGVGGAGREGGYRRRTGEGNEEGEAEVYGGYFVWLTLPEGIDSAVVAERAKVEEELVVAPGKIFEVAGDESAAKFPRNLRLSYSWADEEDIVEGVERLGRVLERMLGGAAGDLAAKRNIQGDTQEFK